MLPAFAPPDSDVHLWLFRLDADAATVSALAAYLAPDEHERAARFRHADDVRRYRVARGALRVLVAGYLGTEPGAVPFAYGAHGKPGLVRNSGRTDLQFNLSHSGDVALVAFCVGHSIGVDLEHAERGVDALALAGRYGSPQEQAMLRAIAPDAQSHRFIELWTCKEAWLKAAGLGITAGLAGVDIEMRNGRPHVAGLPIGVGRADHWSLLRIDPGMGLVAAVALHDPARELGDIGARVSQAIVLGLVGERLVVALRPRGGATTAAL